MANYILAGFFAARGVYHLIDDNDMVWWDIALVAFNIILGAL
jgi:hypothetical protein